MTDLYFVIDTDHYAGNFERPMCAYMTGQLGDCGVGKKEAARFEEEIEDEELRERMEDLIGSEPDDHGCWRPAKIYPNPNWFNNGNGGHFRHDDPTAPERAQKEYDEEILSYANKTIRVCYADKDYGNKAADEYIAENHGKPFSKYPAYMSVAICLNEKPTPEEIEFFKKRASDFAANHKSFDGKPAPIGIEGFRIVTERTVAEEEAI